MTHSPPPEQTIFIGNGVTLGKDVALTKFINLYGCTIGDQCKIGPFVEVQKNVTIGKSCKISSHTFICDGVSIGDDCFIGHGVMFINDKTPRAVTAQGLPESEADWKDRYATTRIGNRVSIGTNATIMCSITIGDDALIGAGSVVTKDVPAGQVWAGNPAIFIKNRE